MAGRDPAASRTGAAPPAGPTSPATPAGPDPRFVTGATLNLLHRCDRRLWLSTHRPELAAREDEFDRLLRERGVAHQAEVRRSAFPMSVGPIRTAGRPLEQAADETLRLLRESRAPLYQPVLLDRPSRRAGVPDFIYWDGDRPVIHDARLAVNLARHGEIPLQLTHYAELFERTVGIPPLRVEITNGRGERVVLPRLGRNVYEEWLDQAAGLLAEDDEPGTLLAHSSCERCPFYDRCWDAAERERRVDVLPGVTVALAAQLRERGIATIEALAAREPAEMRGPGVASSAERLVAQARAHRDGASRWLGPPALMAERPLVWFDLEGEDESEDEAAGIYLWGLAVDRGDGRTEAEAFLAAFDDDGDRVAWERFVERAREILGAHPGARWVHYHTYEPRWFREYARRYALDSGFTRRLEAAFLDLHRIVTRSVCLPLRSYSIKHVAGYTGYAWGNPEAGSRWSMVQYRRARAAGDPAERARILEEIARYNADDLSAMRAVWRWLEVNAPGAASAPAGPARSAPHA